MVEQMPPKGGFREGAGRKPVPEKKRHKPLCVSLSPEHIQTLDWLAERAGKRPSQVVADLIDDAAASVKDRSSKS